MTPNQIVKSLRSPDCCATLVEVGLERFLPPAEKLPEVLHRAMRHAVFSGGRRLRPQFLLQVAQACGARPKEMALALRAACAVELVHTASLVHDDLPCFDDATERRGCPTVHARFGEPIAVLVGDALLTHGFGVLASAPRGLAPRALQLVQLLSRATDSSTGLTGGQSLELQVVKGAADFDSPEFIERYHGMKTGVLFAVAAEMAAIAAGSVNTAAWAVVGQLFGKCYQLAHGLIGLRGTAGAAREAVEPKAALGAPSEVLCCSEEAVRAQLDALLEKIRARVLELAVAPELLLAFLNPIYDENRNFSSSGSR